MITFKALVQILGFDKSDDGSFAEELCAVSQHHLTQITLCWIEAIFCQQNKLSKYEWRASVEFVRSGKCSRNLKHIQSVYRKYIQAKVRDIEILKNKCWNGIGGISNRNEMQLNALMTWCLMRVGLLMCVLHLYKL